MNISGDFLHGYIQRICCIFYTFSITVCMYISLQTQSDIHRYIFVRTGIYLKYILIKEVKENDYVKSFLLFKLYNT